MVRPCDPPFQCTSRGLGLPVLQSAGAITGTTTGWSPMPFPPGCQRALDIGCGQGALTRRVIRSTPPPYATRPVAIAVTSRPLA
jgi:hypothetical protein